MRILRMPLAKKVALFFRPSDGERGWALLSVLWTTALLAMMAAAIETLTVSSVRLERRALEKAHVEAAFDAGLVRAVLGINDSRAANRWRVDGTPQNFSFGGVPMRITIQDDDGLIDLNEADESIIRALFTTSGLDTQTASALTDRVSAWREDPSDEDDDTETLNGGTDADYAAAGRFYKPRHASFQTVKELNLVLGMTPALFKRIEPALTVYSKNANADRNVAPREVLQALLPNDPGQVDKLLAQRAGQMPSGDSDDDDTPPGTISTDESLAGHSFSVRIEALVAGHRSVRNTVIELTEDTDKPFLIQAWE
jgi:general secretion pathway protein K